MNVQDLLQQLNIPFKTAGQHGHARPGWIQIDCPSCTPNSGRYRLGIHLTYVYGNCWSCGGISLDKTLASITSKSWSEIRELTGSVTRLRSLAEDRTKRGKLVLPKGLGNLTPMHKAYLRSRGYNPKEIVKLWGVRGIGISGGLLAMRLFIPTFYKGEIVSWTTRSLSTEHSGRYISASPSEEIYDHKSILYGEDYARDCIIVCEGPFDCWKIGPGAVCTFGTSFKRSQVLKMAKYPKRVICYDNEAAAQRKAKELCSLLAPFDGETWNILLDSKDAGEAKDSEIQKIRKLFL